MQNFSSFRRQLTHRLRNCAARRRMTCAGGPTGEDLKVIALLERLARDAEQLPQALIDDVAERCADRAFSRRFDQTWNSLADVVGTLLVPGSAADLVRWMIDQARQDPGAGLESFDGCPGAIDAPQVIPEPRRRHANRDGLSMSVASEFTAALAVVGPVLAVWEGVTAIGQWRAQAFAASHPATSATVVAVATGDPGRDILPPATEVLAFTPPGEHVPCRFPIDVGHRRPDALGQVLAVVPRAGACEAPLIPGAIGDPMTSVVVACGFLASGAASSKVWRRLRRRRMAFRAGSHAHPLALRVAP